MDERLTGREKVNDVVESLRVKWFMLDAQAKQVVVMACLYIFAAIVGISQKVIEKNLEKESESE